MFVLADEPPVPPAVVATCRMRSETTAPFPRAFSSPDNLVVGPLVMVGAGRLTTEDTVREFGGNKFPLLVRNRRRVTVEVTAGDARLSYARHRRERAIRFVACRRGSGSRGGRHRVTFWSGFVETNQPQCVRLRVWIGRDGSPRSAAIPLGRTCG